MSESLSLSEKAIFILQDRYLKKDKTGNIIETPEQLFERVARAVSSAEKEDQRESYFKKF